MSYEILDEVLRVIPEVIEENPKLFSSGSLKDWYNKRKRFLDHNSLFLDKVIKKINIDSKEFVQKEELFYMQKLYLFYPDHLPKRLLSLSWEHIKLILNLYSYNKRKFYIDLCFDYNISNNLLETYIKNDLYDKYLAINEEISDYNEIQQSNFIKKFLEIESFIYEEI